MKAIKEWKVSVITYPRHDINHKRLAICNVRGPNEQTIRRLILDQAHSFGQFILEFVDIEKG